MKRAHIMLLAFPALSTDAGIALSQPEPAPQTIPDMIRETAIADGIRPEFALEIAYRESRFEPNAVSNEGAMGVMQLMPLTAAALGVEGPFNARENIRGALRWLGELVRSYGSESIADCIYAGGYPELCAP